MIIRGKIGNHTENARYLLQTFSKFFLQYKTHISLLILNYFITKICRYFHCHLNIL